MLHLNHRTKLLLRKKILLLREQREKRKWYLSSGDLIQGIALSFRVGISTARLAVRVTCRALWTKLQPLYLAILERKLGEQPQHAEELVKALCVLHNFLMAQNKGNKNAYCGPGNADSINGVGERQGGQWRQDISQLPLQLARTLAENFVHVARGVRDLYKDNFSSSAGKVSWQQAVLQR
ncbi:hypothetical protein HPB47_006716 [Ixodes persulcatus]|uniref:Uncharacterized protein n=1 Tax=Ixodes persulcatus TaxID=34615 RepID=A0AC60P9K7_IXOPE|nr:hypothetical protein HPB47_006716 [Ixodes persulcatus]